MGVIVELLVISGAGTDTITQSLQEDLSILEYKNYDALNLEL